MAEVTGIPQLTNRLEALKPDIELMTKLAKMANAEQAKLAPVKTGNLRRTIGIQSLTPTKAELVATASYAIYVEDDTRPHDIVPRSKKALSWPSQKAVSSNFGETASFRRTGAFTARSQRRYGNAGFITVKRVHHPGTKGKHFMERGAQAAIAQSGVKDIMVKRWNDAA